MNDEDYSKREYGKSDYGNSSEADAESRDNCRIEFVFGVAVGSVLTIIFTVILRDILR